MRTKKSPKLGDQTTFSLKELIEIGGALGGVLISALYVTGLIVVSLHLWRYGYYSVDLLRTQYIAAGVWAFLPLMFAWLLLWKTRAFLVEYLWSKGWKRIVGWVVAIAGLGMAVSSVVAVLFFHDSAWVAKQGWLDRMIIMALFGVFVVTTPQAAIHNLQLRHKLKQLNMIGLFKTLRIRINVGSTVFWLLIYALIFAVFVYQEIPATLFGGQPREVRLVAKEQDQRALAKSGISFLHGSLQSEPLKLLLDTKEHYVLIIKGTNNTIEVRRDLIQFVIYGSERKVEKGPKPKSASTP